MIDVNGASKPEIIFAARTEAKHPGKSQNQDAIHTHVFTNDAAVPCGLFIVADGVGGHREGSLASQTAVAAIHESLEPLWAKVPANAIQATQFLQSHLYQAIVYANEKIYGYARGRNIRMASTLTCALVYGTLAIIANIGDSRTYLFRRGRLEKITVDHSVVDWLVRQGHLSAAEAANHPYRNVIMHALGSHESPETDMFVRTLQTGDMLLLCSDGVWDTLSDDAIATALNDATSLDTAVAHIIENAQDHSDDISLIIAQLTN